MILTPAELVELTQRKRAYAQRKVLDALAIPYKVRPDGTIVVFREALNAPPQTQPAPPRLRLP